MRVRNFFLYGASELTNDGKNSVFSCANVTDSGIKAGDTVFAGLMLSGTFASSNDPYGNVEVFANSGRVVSNGQISGIAFSKSEISIGTTDKGDLIVIAAR